MAKLAVQIVGDASGFQAAMARVGASAGGLGSRLSSVGKTLTTHLTLPIVAAGGASVKMAIDFQNSMELLHTQAGVSQKAVDSLSKSVLSLAGPTATAPDTLSQGLYHLASQGLRGKQALDALKISAEGARLGQANLEDVTNALGAVIVAHIGGVHSYGQAMGNLNSIVGAGDMRMQDLADAMGTGLPASAKIAGVSLSQVGGALATFGDNNIRGAKAGTLLNSTLRIMGAPSKAAQAALQGVGISADELGNKLRSGGLTAAVGDLKTKMEAAGLSATQQGILLSAAFGGRQSTGVKILIDEFDRLKTKVGEVTQGGATFASSWEAYTQTTAFKMNQLGASMQAAGVSIGTMLLPYVSKLVNALSGMFGWFENLSPSVKKLVIAGAAFLAVLGPTIALVGNLILAVKGLSVAMLFLEANPVVAVIAGLAALGIAFYVAWNHSSEFRRVVTEAIHGVESAAREFVGFFTTEVPNAFRDVLGWVRGHWPEIATIVAGPFAPLVALATNAFGVRSRLVDAFNSIVDFLRNIAGRVEGAAVGIGLAIVHGIISGLGDLGSALAGAILGPIQDILSKASGLLHSAGGVLHDLHIPGFASGGIVTGPTLAMVGEAGPEAIIPLSKLGGMGGGGGGVNVYIGSVNGSADSDFAQKFARELATQLRGGRVPQLASAIGALR